MIRNSRWRLVLLIGWLAAGAAGGGEPDLSDELARTARRAQAGVAQILAYQSIPKGYLVRARDFLNPFPLRSVIWDTLRLAFYVPRSILYPFDAKFTGAGSLIDRKGLVLTNYHVVEDCDAIEVLLDDVVYPARLAGVAPTMDVALLRIDLPAGAAHPVIPLGDSDRMRPGDPVLALGSPLGYADTITQGRISQAGYRLGFQPVEDFLLSSAPVRPGSSGGPLVNRRGEIIGITTVGHQNFESVSFSIPINLVKPFLSDLEAGRRPRHGFLGVVTRPARAKEVRELGLAGKTGALVASVQRGSPAAAAKLRPHDYLVRFEGQAVQGPKALVRLVQRTPAGRTVRLEILRDGRIVRLSVTLERLRTGLQIF